MYPAYRYVRLIGFDDRLRPFKPPLPAADPLAAYAPFLYETEEAALVACATDLSRRWAEVAAGGMAPEEAGLNHYVVLCEVHEDGSIEGGTLALSFPASWGGPDPMGSPYWVVEMTLAEVTRLTGKVDADGLVLPG